MKDIILFRSKHMPNQSRVDKDESNHIRGVANDNIDFFPAILLIIKAISIFFFIMFLIFQKHDLIGLVRI